MPVTFPSLVHIKRIVTSAFLFYLSAVCLRKTRRAEQFVFGHSILRIRRKIKEKSTMSSFARRNEGNDAFIMNHQMAVPGSYGQPESHEFKQESHDFNTHGSGSYHFPQHSFNPYGSQFGQPYGPQSSLSPGLQHLQYTSEHSIPSMTTPDDPRLHHSPQYVTQSRYLQASRYLPRDSLGDVEIESQESRNEATLLSEAVVPPLSGFPDVKEFDQLMQKWVLCDMSLLCLKLIDSSSYVEDLSIKKQDKALIYAKRARNIRTVLIDPKDTAVESAQFRYGRHFHTCNYLLC